MSAPAAPEAAAASAPGIRATGSEKQRARVAALARRLPVLLIAGLALIVSVCPPRGAVAGGESAFGIRGYSDIVERVFAPMGWLQVNETEEGSSRSIVTLSDEAESLPDVRAFAVRSPLLNDIAADDERLWRIRGSSIAGLDPNARRFPNPFGASRWSGDILYQGAAPSALLIADDGRSVEILPTPAGRAAADALPSLPIIGPPGQTSVAQAFSFADENGRALAEVRLIGRHVVVSPLDQESAEIWVDSPNGAREIGFGSGSRGRPVVLTAGGAIRFRRDRQAVGPAFRLAAVADALSRFRPLGERFNDPAMGPFGESIVAAILATEAADGDVALTLDATLHRDLQADLEGEAIRLRRTAGLPPFRAAALVMDARTGALLGLASYPGRQGTGDDAAPGAWIDRNQNFAALPIGSVAKPIIAAAILSQYPELAGLVVSGSSGIFREALGIDLGDEQIDGVTGDRIDFTSFLKRSSNKYATVLMLLGLARDPLRPGRCPTEPYWIAGDAEGAPRRAAPDFLVERQPQPCGSNFGPFNGRLTSILQRGARRPNWLSILRAAFRLPGVESDESQFDTEIWEPLAPAATDGSSPFATVAPETEAFRLGAVRHLQNDYVNLILGGVHSRWSTVKVAEAYARLVTGRAVVPTMLRSRQPRPPQVIRTFALAARAAVLAGMEEVARPGGTAAAELAPALEQLRALRPDETIRIFAKTGTPTLARSETVPARVALDALAQQGLITLDQANRLTVVRKRPGESDVDAFRRMPDARREAARQDVTVDRLASELEVMRRLLTNQRRALGYRHGRLSLPTTRVIERREGEARRNGSVLALVVARYCRAETDPGRPIAALSLVVNVQARQERNLAAGLAGRWLRPNASVARQLFATPARCAGRAL